MTVPKLVIFEVLLYHDIWALKVWAHFSIIFGPGKQWAFLSLCVWQSCKGCVKLQDNHCVLSTPIFCTFLASHNPSSFEWKKSVNDFNYVLDTIDHFYICSFLLFFWPYKLLMLRHLPWFWIHGPKSGQNGKRTPPI